MLHLSSPKSVVHIDIGKIKEENLQSVLSLLEATSYKRVVSDEFAPQVTSCVTFVRYIIKEITGGDLILPKCYIGDMPRSLIQSKWAGARLKNSEEANVGDLVFFYGHSYAQKVEMIGHIGIVTNKENEFHHSVYAANGKGGMRKANFHSSHRNNKLATEDQILNSKDPRTPRE